MGTSPSILLLLKQIEIKCITKENALVVGLGVMSSAVDGTFTWWSLLAKHYLIEQKKTWEIVVIGCWKVVGVDLVYLVVTTSCQHSKYNGAWHKDDMWWNEFDSSDHVNQKWCSSIFFNLIWFHCHLLPLSLILLRIDLFGFVGYETIAIGWIWLSLSLLIAVIKCWKVLGVNLVYLVAPTSFHHSN